MGVAGRAAWGWRRHWLGGQPGGGAEHGEGEQAERQVPTLPLDGRTATANKVSITAWGALWGC